MTCELCFSSKDGGKTFTRRFFGLEAFLGTIAGANDGFGFFTNTLKVSFRDKPTEAALAAAIKTSWIRLRYLAPIVGTKTVVDSSSASSYLYQYRVPSSLADAENWANETIIWSKEKHTVRERDDCLKGHWWKPSDSHHDYELHVGPDVQDNVWHFLIIAGHYSVDARSVVQLFGHFLTYLDEQIRGNGIDISTLKWGEETKRLAPAPVVVALKAARLPLSLESPTEPAPPATTPEQAAPPPAPIIFLRSHREIDPNHPTGQYTSVIWLTEDETSKFRRACKAHNFTVTQAITGLMFLTEVEWVLKRYNDETEEEAKAELEAYKNSTVIPSLWNIVDQRYKFKQYALHGAEEGSPALGIDGFPIMLDMNAIRKVVKYDEQSKKVWRDNNQTALWGVVKAAAEGYSSTPLTLEGYIEREKGNQKAAVAWDPRGFQIPAFVASSIGDIDRFGYLSKFSPRVPANERSSLSVEEIWQSDRMTEAVRMLMSWQWNGRIAISAQTGAKYVSKRAMDAFMEILKDWIDTSSK